jgi:hypothetical protein
MVRVLKRRWAVALGAAVVLALVALGVAAFQPWTANHFGYALPGPHGLPYRVHVLGRNYENLSQCAGAGWCAGVAPESTCWSRAKLSQEGMWPLAQVGTIVTLFGQSRPVLSPPIPAGMTSTLMFVPHTGDCYLVFVLEGGP